MSQKEFMVCLFNRKDRNSDVIHKNYFPLLTYIVSESLNIP